MKIEEWDERNSGKPVSEWEPFPKEMFPFVIYPNGFVVTTLEEMEKLTKNVEGVTA